MLPPYCHSQTLSDTIPIPSLQSCGARWVLPFREAPILEGAAGLPGRVQR
jgi:hypothetical protein